MFVHAQFDHTVVEAAIPASLAHDQQRGGLLTTAIAASALPRRQRLHQPVRKTSLRPLEGLGERAHGVFADEDVALRREVRPGIPPAQG